jgi:hypothetical protein
MSMEGVPKESLKYGINFTFNYQKHRKDEIPNPNDADKYPCMVVYNIQGITYG